MVKDLYSLSKDTQQFLHARYAIGGGDVLAPYKDTITQWINPGDLRKPLSVAKARKAIVDYKKAVGEPQGLAELGVFYASKFLYRLIDAHRKTKASMVIPPSNQCLEK